MLKIFHFLVRKLFNHEDIKYVTPIKNRLWWLGVILYSRQPYRDATRSPDIFWFVFFTRGSGRSGLTGKEVTHRLVCHVVYIHLTRLIQGT